MRKKTVVLRKISVPYNNEKMAKTGRIKIAIAENYTMIRGLLVNLINIQPNFQVIAEADNGRQLLDMMEQTAEKPDIVLLDIEMPVLNGYDTMLVLKKTYEDVRVIVLTVFEGEYSIIRMINNGARAYLLKTCKIDELFFAINNVHTTGYHYTQITPPRLFSKKVDLPKVTERERVFLELNCSQLSYAEIAIKMYLSVRTIQDYQQSLCEKFGLKTRMDLALFSLRTGLVSI